MSALGHTHGNAFLRNLGAGNADEAEHNVVAGGDRVSEERQLPACWIGEDGFEDEAFTLSDEFASKGIGNLRGLVGRYVQFARDVVGADEWQSRLSKMGMKKSRLASTV